MGVFHRSRKFQHYRQVYETLNIEACYAEEVATRGRRQWSKWWKEASNAAAGACRSLDSVVVKLITPRNCLN